jgi:hypothetical protein
LAFEAWGQVERGLKRSGLIDDRLLQQIAKADEKWRGILERVTATIHTLA